MPRKQKVIVFAPPAVVAKYEVLSRQYGLSRSRLYCMSLEEGFDATAAWCSRMYSSFEPAARSPVAGAAARAPALAPTPAPEEVASGSGEESVELLQRYAESLSVQVPEATEDVFRTMLVTQAGVLGLSSALSEPVVVELVRQRFAASSDPEEGLVPALDD